MISRLRAACSASKVIQPRVAAAIWPEPRVVLHLNGESVTVNEDSGQDDVVTFDPRACTCIAGVNDQSSGTCKRAIVDDVVIRRDQYGIKRSQRVQIPRD